MPDQRREIEVVELQAQAIDAAVQAKQPTGVGSMDQRTATIVLVNPDFENADDLEASQPRQETQRG